MQIVGKKPILNFAPMFSINYLLILSRSAERRRPLDEFNNGVVMTHRPLKDNELFEIRIDRLVDKWSGSIEVGVTTHCPSGLQFPATMTNLRSGKNHDSKSFNYVSFLIIFRNDHDVGLWNFNKRQRNTSRIW